MDAVEEAGGDRELGHEGRDVGGLDPVPGPDFPEAVLPRHPFTFSSGVSSGKGHDRRKMPLTTDRMSCVVPTPSWCIALSRRAS